MLNRLRPSPTRLVGRKVMLRLPKADDFNEWANLRTRSRAFLEPWEPAWPDLPFSKREFRRTVRRHISEAQQKKAFSFFILSPEETLMGGITLSNIRYGVCQNGEIGYWMGEPFAGKGYMHDAIDTLCDFGFHQLRLHRIQAACIPGNERSERLLKKAGFEREGLLRSYLLIGGAWRDHHLYARLRGDSDRLGDNQGSGM